MFNHPQYKKGILTLDALSSNANTCEVVTIKAADLKPCPINWLFDGWLAQGKFHILAGAPGVGKTTLAMAFAAIVSSGGSWPDGKRCKTGNVVIWSGEDDATDTLLPRLLVMGGNPDHIHFVKGTKQNIEQRAFDPARDMALLQAECERIGNVALVIIDPCSTTIPGDSHKNSETRKGLQPLVDLAAAMQCAVLGITHFSKGGAGNDPTQRVIGSVAFSAVARVVLVAAKTKDANGHDCRILCRSKSNIGADEGGYSYTLEQVETEQFPGVYGSRIVWGEAMTGTAREFLCEQGHDDATSALDEAKTFLHDLLADGLMPAKEIYIQAKEAGISKSTLDKAKRDLAIKVKKGGMNEGWYWCLPPKENTEGIRQNTKVSMQNTRVSSGNDEYLREQIINNRSHDTYIAHHGICQTCTAAGKGYGKRCNQGLELWEIYQQDIELSIG